MANATAKDEKCCCPCHKMFGIFTILFGLNFLLGAFEVISAHIVSIVWPIIVILAGATKLCSSKCTCCSKT